MGEGWHNNHHYYPAAARQGFFWWEIDFTYYILRLLQWLRLINDLRPVPTRVRIAGASPPRSTELGVAS
jgi:stearoyl-CoA desaturase (delta-9 desaturase)